MARINSGPASSFFFTYDQNLVGDLEHDTEYADENKKKKDRKPITSISYLLKLYKKSLQPSVDETAEAETPDVGTSEAQSEPQEKVVSVPQSEEDFVALMIERGLDLDKVVEIIFDLDNVKKVA